MWANFVGEDQYQNCNHIVIFTSIYFLVIILYWFAECSRKFIPGNLKLFLIVSVFVPLKLKSHKVEAFLYSHLIVYGTIVIFFLLSSLHSSSLSPSLSPFLPSFLPCSFLSPPTFPFLSSFLPSFLPSALFLSFFYHLCNNNLSSVYSF